MTDYGYGFDWEVIRTTTDKLDNELNDLAWSVFQIQFIGGRDWVIIARQPSDGSTGEKPIFKGTAIRSKGNRFWEITVPSIGPNDEPVVTQARNAAEIHTMAKDAVAVTLDWPQDRFDVDIDVDLTIR